MGALATIRTIYESFGRGDIGAIVAQLEADVVWEHDATDHGIPWLEPGRGLDHALSFFAVVGAQLQISKFDLRGLFEAGDQVIAVIDIEATVKTTGHAYRDLELHLWTFGPSGKVSKFRHFVDTHLHWLASQK